MGQTAAAHDRRAGMRRRHRTAADDLRARWHATAGWPPDWWVPAIDAVARALADSRDPRPALRWYGRTRAAQGYGLARTLDDARGGVPFRWVPTIVAGWRAVAEAAPDECPHRTVTGDPTQVSGSRTTGTDAAMTIAPSRALLQGLYLELSAEIDEAQSIVAVDARGDHSGEDEGDVGARTAQWEQYASLVSSIRARRDQVAAALERLDAGTYGLCATCGESIPPERLDACPSVTECVDCKRASERF